MRRNDQLSTKSIIRGFPRLSCLYRVVDLNIGESQEVVLADGKKSVVKLLEVDEKRCEMRNAEKKYILPKIDGKNIDLNPEYAYFSPYMRNKAGSSIVTLLYGARKWEYDFEKNTITEVKE